MTLARLAKGLTDSARIVAVIASPADLRRALVLRKPPDFFELRLDALCSIVAEVKRALPRLRASLIITARHPSEGGMNNFTTARRRELLLQFLPYADYVDVELRSAKNLSAVIERRAKRIISVHPSKKSVNLDRALVEAKALGADIFKIVTRTETFDEMNALLEFFERNKKRMPISAMGAGRFGRESRIKLARGGSVLNYVHLGAANIEGQLSLTEMRQLSKSQRIL